MKESSDDYKDLKRKISRKPGAIAVPCNLEGEKWDACIKEQSKLLRGREKISAPSYGSKHYSKNKIKDNKSSLSGNKKLRKNLLDGKEPKKNEDGILVLEALDGEKIPEATPQQDDPHDDFDIETPLSESEYSESTESSNANPRHTEMLTQTQSMVGAFSIRGIDAADDDSSRDESNENSNRFGMEIQQSDSSTALQTPPPINIESGHASSIISLEDGIIVGSQHTIDTTQRISNRSGATLDHIIPQRRLTNASFTSSDASSSMLFSVEYQQNNDNLAIAREVIEDEAADYGNPPEDIQMASEYDPDAKPPLYKHRRFGLYCIGIGVFFLTALMLAIIYVVTQNSANSIRIIADMELPPTAAPTTFRESIGIRQSIEKFMQTNKFRDHESAESKAMNWIINVDPMQLLPDSQNLFQRYLLAYLYFQTSEKGPWLSCSPPVGKQRDSCTYKWFDGKAMDYRDKRGAVRWLSKQPECEWAQVECDTSGRVLELNLVGQKLSGSFPFEIAKLPSLNSISFGYNQLSGRLPELALLPNLKSIELGYNFFTGTIPKKWYSLQGIEYISVAGNELIGTIPSEFAQLPSLRTLFLFSNNFSGTIPSRIFTKLQLEDLKVNGNNLVGSIPSEIGLMSNTLSTLFLSDNGFIGTLPTEMGKLSNMMWVKIENTQLSGTVPDSFWENWSNADYIYLRGNQLSGTLSSKIGQMSNLSSLLLANNAFSGTIPAEFGSMPELRRLTLQNNNFHGEVPIEVCSMVGPNRLLETWADCSPSEISGVPALGCDCCTVCCNHNTKICEDNF